MLEDFFFLVDFFADFLAVADFFFAMGTELLVFGRLDFLAASDLDFVVVMFFFFGGRLCVFFGGRNFPVYLSTPVPRTS